MIPKKCEDCPYLEENIDGYKYCSYEKPFKCSRIKVSEVKDDEYRGTKQETKG